MRPYFEKMKDLGKALTEAQVEQMKESKAEIDAVVADLEKEIERVKNAGMPAAKVRERGQMTVWDRIEYIVDPGTFCPLHTLYNPLDNEEGMTGVIDGLARISGRWCVLIGFDNKVMAGAWIAGQAENILRVTDIAKNLNIPLVWLVNCSGVKLPEQEKVYANRRGNGTCFFRHAELEKMGIPVLAGIYGTNPAGGGYQGISPTILLAHKDCNIAVGGGGIVSGMSPKGFFDEVILQDFPIRGQEVYLHVKRRRWLNQDTGLVVFRDWSLVAKGTRITEDFAAFLKAISRYPSA